MTDVSFAITGDNRSFLTALKESEDAVKEASASMQEGFEGFTGVFEKINGFLGGFTAILAGGAAFKEAISAVTELAHSVHELQEEFGLTSVQASTLSVALTESRVTQEQFATAGNALQRTLRTNEDAINRLGVATRDSDGDFRNTLDIMMDVNTALLNLKEGTDRNVAAQTIYSRSWAQVQDILRVTQAQMVQAKRVADSLGLTMGQEQVKAVTDYNKAMASVKLVMEGVWNAIGQQLMPYLTELGNWFASIGPSLVKGFGVALASLITVFEGVNFAVNALWNVLSGTFNGIYELFAGFANMAERALHLDWKGAAAAMKSGWQNMQAVGNNMTAQIAADYRVAGERAGNAWVQGLQLAPHTSPEQSESGGRAPSTDKNRLARWEEELEGLKANLAQQNAAEGNFHEFSKQQEEDYWQNILNTQHLSAAESIAVRKKIASDQVAIAQQQFEGELAQMKASEAAQKNNLDGKLVIAQAYAAKVKAAYGADSKQYADAAKDIITIEQQKQEQILQLNQIRQNAEQAQQLGSIDQAENQAQLEVALHVKTNAQLLAQEALFENQRYSIRRQALEQEMSLVDPTRDPVKYAQMSAQLEALETQHQTKMTQIHSNATREDLKYYTDFFNSLDSGFASVVTNLLNGTKTLGQSFQAMFQMLVNSFAQVLAKMAADWLTNQIATQVLGKETAVSQITANAGVAATAAMASVAAIPYYGWAMAPEVGATTQGAALSFLADASASGGYDIPAGVNPLVQTHAKEMILPANLADTVRNMAAGGGGSGGGGTARHEYVPVGSDHGLVRLSDLPAHVQRLNRQWKGPKGPGRR